MKEYLNISNDSIRYAENEKDCNCKVSFSRKSMTVKIEVLSKNKWLPASTITYIKVIQWVLVKYEKILNQALLRHNRREELKALTMITSD